MGCFRVAAGCCGVLQDASGCCGLLLVVMQAKQQRSILALASIPGGNPSWAFVSG